MTTSTSPGRFVSFEGIDGSGKSTQARLFADHLAQQGHDVILTREPGGSPGAEEIRRLLVEGDPGRWSAETEILLFTAARRDHLERTIHPALRRGTNVVTDRFADSTRIYQGTTRGDLSALVDRLHDMMIGQSPDLTLIIDLDPATALGRTKTRAGDEARFERFGLEFQRRVRSEFAALAGRDPARCKLIDGSGSSAEVAARVADAFAAHVPA